MKENFDRLTKNLAGGMSRREALTRFLAATSLGALFGVTLQAQGQGQGPANCPPGHSYGPGVDVDGDGCSINKENCHDFCAELYGPGTEDFVECMQQSGACALGECSMRAYAAWMCVSAY